MRWQSAQRRQASHAASDLTSTDGGSWRRTRHASQRRDMEQGGVGGRMRRPHARAQGVPNRRIPSQHALSRNPFGAQTPTVALTPQQLRHPCLTVPRGLKSLNPVNPNAQGPPGTLRAGTWREVRTIRCRCPLAHLASQADGEDRRWNTITTGAICSGPTQPSPPPPFFVANARRSSRRRAASMITVLFTFLPLTSGPASLRWAHGPSRCILR